MEIYKNLPEGTLADVIDNQIYRSPSPVFNHQILAKKITRLLDEIVENNNMGFVIPAPFDVYLDEVSNAVQPDIVVIFHTNTGALDKPGHFKGVPDLIVEILSPGHRDYDLVKKKNLYERFGVQEYWAIDPETKKAIGFALDNAAYKLFADEVGVVRSSLLHSSFVF